jgi:hypothetical protein
VADGLPVIRAALLPETPTHRICLSGSRDVIRAARHEFAMLLQLLEEEPLVEYGSVCFDVCIEVK